MNTASTSSLLLLCLLLALAGCMPSRRSGEEVRAPKAGSVDSLSFDLLGLKQDLEVMPERYPADSRRPGSETVTPETSSGSEQFGGERDSGSVEATGGQVFKVQVLSSKLFGEARQAQRVAEEIFDQPVTMDYEVPYFKVRVGNFRDRYEAERYSQRVRSAGYSDAWVVAAATAVRKVAPMYQEGSQSPAADSIEVPDTASGGKE